MALTSGFLLALAEADLCMRKVPLTWDNEACLEPVHPETKEQPGLHPDKVTRFVLPGNLADHHLLTGTPGEPMPRPYVLLSVAQSLDGYIDDTSPDRLVLSSEEDLDRVDKVRAGCDAILIGATTLRRDNPRLRVKSPERRAARVERGLPPELLRVIVTRSGSLSADLRIWRADGDKISFHPC